MAKDDGLMRIEFESSTNSLASAPDSVSDGKGPGPWPALIVALVVGAMFAALIWFNSGNEPVAAPEDSTSEQAEVEGIDDAVEPEDLPVDNGVDDNSVIPELSGASIALEPIPLLDPSFATIFDGQLFAVANGSIGDELVTPAVSQTSDGVTWEEFRTQATVDGVPNTVGYSWSDIRRLGDGLAVTAFDFDRVRVAFISSNGVDWEQVSTEQTLDAGKLFFEPLSVADDYLAGLSLGGSEALAQFVEDHTTADDVDAVCFVDSQAVIGCDQTTEWPFTEQTIDSPAGSEAVFSCLNRLSVIGPAISLSRIGREGSSVEPLDMRIYLTGFLPVALNDGRVAGVDALAFFGDPAACDGLATVEEADPDPFYIFDPITGVVERAALDPELNPASTELLGEISIAGPDVFLFRSNGRLWTLDFGSDTWTMLDVALFDEQVVLADSGDRLYSFNGSDLRVLDLVASGEGIEVVETTVYVALPTSGSFTFIQSASKETLIFETAGTNWLVHVPSGLRCAEEYAEALAGNGLVEDC